MIGTTLGHYRIVAKLGAGGMGEVYRAEDTHLKRQVALKIVPASLSDSPERLERFQREAESLASLDHPNIVTIYSVEKADGVQFITMQLVEGKMLSELVPEGGMAVEQALDIAHSLAAALVAAHNRGVIHRDLKPANIMVDVDGRVRVLDFGLAKALDSAIMAAAADASEATDPGGLDLDEIVRFSQSPTLTGQMTEPGRVLGTMPYMSPEQAEGKAVDARSDLFSLGVVVYEMLAGERPFRGDTWISLASAISREEPDPLHIRRRDLPSGLEEVVERCLEKDPEARFKSASDLLAELGKIRDQLQASKIGLRARLRHPAVAIGLVLVVISALAVGGWLVRDARRAKWARTVALPEIEELLQERRMFEAYELAKRAEEILPDDTTVKRYIATSTWPISVRTEPPGAEIYYQDYKDIDGPWVHLGTSPLEGVVVPKMFLRWRVVKEGFHEAVRAPNAGPELVFHLVSESESTDVAYVPGGRFTYGGAQAIELEEYWLDRYEVTNRRYKEFVDAGGYEDPEYWDHPVIDDGRTLSWEESMARFVDATGRPGPSSWELGSYREGEDDFPVRGVSWYEAAAYAKYAGASLPTVYHWKNAAGYGVFSEILLLSNFEGRGPEPVGANEGVGPYGTYDMAGNVKEWCWNQTGDRRYILGGSWVEPSYMFQREDARNPLERFETYGFRTARYSSLADEVLAPIETLTFDPGSIEPVDDDVFEVLAGFRAYDPGELDARIESVDEGEKHWRRETITFNAAYDGERILAYLMVPTEAEPPYQTVLFFPPGAAALLRTSETLSDGILWDFLPRSGRAVMYPVYKGTYERGGGEDLQGPRAFRDLILAQAKDVSRSIDYLETRSDIDGDRLAYLAVSMGSSIAPVYLAGEERVKAAVLIAAGYSPGYLRLPPEIQPWNYAPRTTMPVLLIGTRNDFVFPLETSQKPLFDSLGTPEADKRHAVFEGGHIAPTTDAIHEVLDWLDLYLGPVE